MSQISPAALPALQPPLDKVQMIRLSTRCFWCGLLGMVPVLGIGLAIQAILFYRRSADQGHELFTLRRLYGYWMIAFIYTVIFQLLSDWIAAMLTFAIFLGLQAFVLWWDFRTTASRYWNPARSYVYWGVGLALSGAAILLALLEWIVAALLSR